MVNVAREWLFGLVALRARLIDADQLFEACKRRATCRDAPWPDLLVELGLIEPAARVKHQLQEATGRRS